jgi:hypothetical protein
MKQLRAPTTHEGVSNNLKMRQKMPLFGNVQCNKGKKKLPYFMNK